MINDSGLMNQSSVQSEFLPQFAASEQWRNQTFNQYKKLNWADSYGGTQNVRLQEHVLVQPKQSVVSSALSSSPSMSHRQ